MAYAVARREADFKLRGASPVARRETPSDLAQSAIREVLEAAGKLENRGPEALRALIKQVVTHKLHEKLRYHGAQRRSQKQEVRWTEHGGAAAETTDDPAEKAVARETADEEQQLLKSLSPRETEVIEMRLRGMSHRDIAAELGISEDSSSKILSRARELRDRSD